MTKRTKVLLGGCVLSVVCALTVIYGQVRDTEAPGVIINAKSIVSASVTVPEGGDPATLLETPQDGRFILTQVCVEDEDMAGGPALGGNTLGLIVSGQGSHCTTYDPGIAVPGGETLTCNPREFRDRTCTITGVLHHGRGLSSVAEATSLPGGTPTLGTFNR